MIFERYDCIYCGMTAESRDHVVAHSYESNSVSKDWSHDKIVPSCKECNCLLSDLFLPSIAERADYITGILKVRYRKLLSSPDWSQKELAALGKRLRDYVKGEQNKKRTVQMRISYAELMANNTCLTPQAYWESMGRFQPILNQETKAPTI